MRRNKHPEEGNCQDCGRRFGCTSYIGTLGRCPLFIHENAEDEDE